ncbi:hypothetical protein E9993_05330 [Labilibacter sediminis]|nr:hypothetical protein E9993_05330 [Labilibacter sediminis]
MVVLISKFLARTKLKLFNLFILWSFIGITLFSQSLEVEKLKVKREQYLSEIKNAKNLLLQKGNSRKEMYSQLSILNAQITAQNNIINSYSQEISEINGIISENEVFVNELKSEIITIKKGYEKLIIEANKQFKSNNNEFMIIFSASSFSEAYRRFNLMKQYGSYRKKQADLLFETQQVHDSIITINKAILNQKEKSYHALIEERELLKLSVAKKQGYIAKLKKDENWLKRDIKKKQKFSKELQLSIEKLILEASKKESSYSFSNFSNAKGKLNWPVKGGVVTSYFGEHNHSVLKGVKIKNNGIDITASKENEVNSVYEGTVSRVIAIPGYNKAVIIRHGKYLTVYANLATVYVKNGQEIKSNQSIGQIFADKNNKSGILHFEIWEESKKINPLHWLHK